MRKCLVLGHHGMLGSYLFSYIPKAPGGAQWELAGVDLPEIDITQGGSVAAAFAAARPELVINCAAYTDVDGAESHRDEAFAANAAGPELLARAAAAAGAVLVHISTDFVFDGLAERPYREDDEPNPKTTYGKSKLAGEMAVAAIAAEHLIVRTAWLYGPNGRNFVDTIVNLAREKGRVRVVADQHGSPTFTGVLSRFVWALVCGGARGIFHVAGRGGCSWYELAREAMALCGIEAEVEPVTTPEFPRPAARPRNSRLDCGKAETFLGEGIPDWRVGLREYLRPA